MRVASALGRSALIGVLGVAFAAPSAVAADFSLQVRDTDGEPRVARSLVCVGQGCAAAGGPGFVSSSDGVVRYAASEGDVIEVFDPFARATAQRTTASSATATEVTIGNVLSPGPHPSESIEEREFLALVNAARGSAGLVPVQPLTRAYDAADRHNAWMRRNDTQSHTGEFGTSPSDRAAQSGIRPASAAEIAFLRGGSAQTAFDGFMASPGHHAIIMSPEMRFVGVAGDDGSWVGMFMRESTCTIACGAPAFDPSKPSFSPSTSGLGSTFPVPATGTGTGTGSSNGSGGAGSSRAPRPGCRPGFVRAPKAARLSRTKVRLTYALTACTPAGAKVTATVGKQVTRTKARTRMTLTSRSSRIVVRLVVGKTTRAKATVRIPRVRR